MPAGAEKNSHLTDNHLGNLIIHWARIPYCMEINLSFIGLTLANQVIGKKLAQIQKNACLAISVHCGRVGLAP